MKKAIITGITGQDGSYLAEFLLEKDYEVYGVYRRSSVETFGRIGHIKDKIKLVCADLLDVSLIADILHKVNPDEVYNLAAQSFVPASWDQPILTGDINALGATRLLEAIRRANPKIKFYQASSSEMFGKAQQVPQTEKTYFYPRSPYGVSKVYAYWITKNYRESYNMFTCNGILFNHESPRRGKQFVTRKVTHSAAKIKLGLQEGLTLGNLEAKRDWGYAKDYVEAMWLMLQHDHADDYVIATGKTHSVRDLCKIAFDHLGLNYEEHVNTDSKLIRPAEVDMLMGDASKAKKDLGWKPKTSFKELIELMVNSDLKLLEKK